ncbi:Filamin-C [Frankliniella fusca]|uniref:Filamin-C n=1 Tax=Frankliniella fusca TaxID=407009 RepID=A0AAE1GTH6_9NEOP|nr:Filamin-C [Frankliniella fusca]
MLSVTSLPCPAVLFQMARVQLLLAALVVALSATPPRTEAAAVTPAEPGPGQAAVRAEDRADAEADADPGTGGSSFFDTFMAFLGSSALHKAQPADAQADDSVVAAASDTQSQQVEQGRSLAYDGGLVSGAPLQDGGQADRVKRTGALPASLLGGVVNHKLGYLNKGSHHIHFHNYNTKCDKPHFSLWEFKKAILHKLLEAAKAIGGGVLAIKGKLLTAKGHLVAAKGRKLATKGEELTEFGKGILAKALGHGGVEEVHHTAPSAPSGPGGPGPAHYAAYGAPPLAAAHFQGYNYPAPQYLPASGAGAPSGHGYNAAVSLLNEYSRAGFGYAAGARAHASKHSHGPGAPGALHRTGQAPTGPSATGPAGTLPGNLQAGLLVLQPAPSAPQRSGSVAAASSPHLAAIPAPGPGQAPGQAQAHAPAASPDHRSGSVAFYSSQDSAAYSATPSQPLVLAPEFMDTVSAAGLSNKVRRYAMLPPSSRSLDVAMAAVVRGLHLHGSDLDADALLSPDTDILRSAAERLAAEQ